MCAEEEEKTEQAHQINYALVFVDTVLYKRIGCKITAQQIVWRKKYVWASSDVNAFKDSIT